MSWLNKVLVSQTGLVLMCTEVRESAVCSSEVIINLTCIRTRGQSHTQQNELG